MRKVGSAEVKRCGTREKQITGAVEGRNPCLQRGAKEKGGHKKVSTKPLAWKIGAVFCDFLQPTKLKAWSFKGQQT